MRRCLLILPLLLLTAPAAAHAGGFATTGLSSTPDGLQAGQPWKVELTILQHGRTPLSDLSPEIVTSTPTATARRSAPSRRQARALRRDRPFPKAGQWSYAVYDGFNHTPAADHSVVIQDPAPVVDRPDPVGPPGLPIALAGLLALARRAARAHAAPPPARHGPAAPGLTTCSSGRPAR